MARTEPDGGGRRKAAAALSAAGVAVLVAAVVVLVLGLTGAGSDDGDDEPSRPAPGTVALDHARFGVELRHPRTWRRDDERRAIRLTSADRRLGLSITTVASRPAAARVRESVERGVVRTLRGGRVLRRSQGRLGGLPARLSAIRGRNARGETLDVLLAVVASRWRTYAVVTFGSPGASQGVLRQGESVLASLRFSRPRGA